MGAVEIILIALVAVSLGGCLVYSIMENAKNNKK